MSLQKSGCQAMASQDVAIEMPLCLRKVTFVSHFRGHEKEDLKDHFMERNHLYMLSKKE